MNTRLAATLYVAGTLAGLGVTSIVLIEQNSRLKRDRRLARNSAEVWERYFDRALSKMTPQQIHELYIDTLIDNKFTKIVNNM